MGLRRTGKPRVPVGPAGASERPSRPTRHRSMSLQRLVAATPRFTTHQRSTRPVRQHRTSRLRRYSTSRPIAWAVAVVLSPARLARVLPRLVGSPCSVWHTGPALWLQGARRRRPPSAKGMLGSSSWPPTPPPPPASGSWRRVVGAGCPVYVPVERRNWGPVPVAVHARCWR